MISAALYTLVILVLLIQMSRLSIHAKRCGKLKIDGKIISDSKVVIADSYVQKRVGLLNHCHLPLGTGLLIKGTHSVHTRGMIFPIDIIYLNRNERVILTIENALPDSKKLPGPSHTKSVLEMPAGSIQHYSIQPSTILQVIS